jgi:hypothetical protein
VTAADSPAGRVTTGDEVSVSFSSPKPITDVTVSVGGTNLAATSDDGLEWTATGRLGAIEGGGLLDIAIDHTTGKGQIAATVHGTTDGTSVYGSDESNLIDLADFQTVNAAGEPDETEAAQAALMIDSNVSAFSDVKAVDGEQTLTWDGGEGSTFSLVRLECLALRDNNGMVRVPDLAFQGSNDLDHWTTLNDDASKTYSWQNLPSADDGGFRYLRIAKSTNINVTELRAFGTVELDIDPIFARADEVDLDAQTSGSQIVFPREVSAVRAAFAEDGADETALALRRLDAWDLLDTLTTEAPLTLDLSLGRGEYRHRRRDHRGRQRLAHVLRQHGHAHRHDHEVLHQHRPADRRHRIRGPGREIPSPSERRLPCDRHARPGTQRRRCVLDDVHEHRHPVAGWNTLTLTEPVTYEALRISGGSGYCNVAKLQFIRRGHRQGRPRRPPRRRDRADRVRLDRRLLGDPRHGPRSPTTRVRPNARWTSPPTSSPRQSLA